MPSVAARSGGGSGPWPSWGSLQLRRRSPRAVAVAAAAVVAGAGAGGCAVVTLGRARRAAAARRWRDAMAGHPSEDTLEAWRRWEHDADATMPMPQKNAAARVLRKAKHRREVESVITCLHNRSYGHGAGAAG